MAILAIRAIRLWSSRGSRRAPKTTPVQRQATEAMASRKGWGGKDGVQSGDETPSGGALGPLNSADCGCAAPN
eukprot:4222622-Alexandrium_andersonii.AAC.1